MTNYYSKMLDLLYRVGKFERSEDFAQACQDQGICSFSTAAHHLATLKKLPIIQTDVSGKYVTIKSLISVQMTDNDFFDLMENFTHHKRKIRDNAKEVAKIAKYHLKVDDKKFQELMETGSDILSQIEIIVDVLDLLRSDWNTFRSSIKRNEIESMIDVYSDLKKEILKDFQNAHNDLSYQLTFKKISDNL